MNENADFTRFVVKLGVGVVAAITLLVAGCNSYEFVDTGNVGIKLSLRAVDGPPLEAGLHFINPFTQDIIEMDVQTQKWSAETTGYTKDVQQATIRFTLNYRLDPSRAGETYRDVGMQWTDRLVGQVVHDSVKQEIGQFNAVDLVSQREAARAKIEEKISTVLLTRGVVTKGFQLTNIDYSPNFEKAVEEKVVAEQQAIREKNNTARFEELARQAVATAKGQADATLLNAKAEAESIEIRGRALRDNPKLVDLTIAQRWDGKLPQYSLGGAMPLLTLPQAEK